jgi:hypothetical protein
MKDYIRSLFEGYKNKGILIDTNILLLWIVGSVNRSRITSRSQGVLNRLAL